MESMYIIEKEWMDIFSYVDSSKLCHVINNFPDLNQNIGQEDIISPPNSSSRAIE